jgi:uncharacterized protein with HEPN domain
MSRKIIDYLNDMLDECEYLLKRKTNLNYSAFLHNEDLKKAFVRSLEVIGEAAKNIPQEIRAQYPQINWRDVAGIRDIVIHAYFGIDYRVVWKTIEIDIPALKENLEKILNKL